MDFRFLPGLGLGIAHSRGRPGPPRTPVWARPQFIPGGGSDASADSGMVKFTASQGGPGLSAMATSKRPRMGTVFADPSAYSSTYSPTTRPSAGSVIVTCSGGWVHSCRMQR